MSIFDSQVYKCERCGELYTPKAVNSDKAFKYVIANNSHPLSNREELSLCPGCLRSLEEWMDGSSVQAEERPKETPLAKALREFSENVKSVKTSL